MRCLDLLLSALTSRTKQLLWGVYSKPYFYVRSVFTEHRHCAKLLWSRPSLTVQLDSSHSNQTFILQDFGTSWYISCSGYIHSVQCICFWHWSKSDNFYLVKIGFSALVLLCGELLSINIALWENVVSCTNMKNYVYMTHFERPFLCD